MKNTYCDSLPAGFGSPATPQPAGSCSSRMPGEASKGTAHRVSDIDQPLHYEKEERENNPLCPGGILR